MNEKAYFRPTIATIDLQAIQQNVSNLKKYLKTDAEIIAVVKANAYGHGDVQVSEAAFRAGATMLAVATPEEALHIRTAIKEVPLLILGAVPQDFIPFASQNNITLTVFSAQWIVQASRDYGHLDLKVKVHMKIDSGMGRIGVREEAELIALQKVIVQSPIFELDGIFTHFATADEETSEYYEIQKSKFMQLVSSLDEKPRLVHAANTAASLVKDRVEFDAVRFGISMYGLSPSEFVETQLPFELNPALTLESELVHVKKIHKGEHVGYGAKFEAATDETWVGTLPIGYADGLLRGLEGQEVLVQGERVKIIGRICMDQTMVQLPREMAVGEKVVLIGKQNNNCIPMQEWADRLQTIVYEISCMLSSRITRVYKD